MNLLIIQLKIFLLRSEMVLLRLDMARMDIELSTLRLLLVKCACNAARMLLKTNRNRDKILASALIEWSRSFLTENDR